MKKARKIISFILAVTFVYCVIIPVTPVQAMGEQVGLSGDLVNYSGHHSFKTLTTSNGIAAATFSETDKKLNVFKPHIYSNYDGSTVTKDYLQDARFGFRQNGKTALLSSMPFSSLDYINGTNIIKAVQDNSNGIKFESYYFVPFHDPNREMNDGRFMVMLVKVTNEGADASDCSVLSLLNLHMGGGNDLNSEDMFYNSADDYLKESKGNAVAIYKNLNMDGSYYTAGNTLSTNPLRLVNNNKHFDNQIVNSGNDLIAGFENRVNSSNTFAAGDSQWFGVVIGLTEDGDEANLWNNMNSFIKGRSAQKILEDEQTWWNNWHYAERMPSGVSSEEAAVYRQATAVLKMAQCREEGKSYGQVLASLIPGIWNMAWVRDGIYSIQALLASGHNSEAKAALKFMLDADMRKDVDGKNYYQKMYIENIATSDPYYGLGMDLGVNYAISVCRYYGNGTEESDLTWDGYNIEYDGWGLFLWGVGEYTRKTGDRYFVENYWDSISNRTADLLVKLIDPKDNLLYADSSIWEHHWVPYGTVTSNGTGGRQRFTYSNICAYKGLKSAAYLAGLLGDSRQSLYNAKAEDIKNAILSKLVVTPTETGKQTLGASLEQISKGDSYHDASTVEAINFGIVDPSSSLASGIIEDFDQFLKMSVNSPGYMRNDDGTDYDLKEWAFIDLRVASALKAMGDTEKAGILIEWITKQACSNFNLVPELLTPGTADFDGAIPMAGFGSGSYILAINDKYSAKSNLNITTADLQKCKVGEVYSGILTASGGTAPYTWSVEGLPEGLAITTEGAISGTPVKAGTYNVKIAVTDSNMTTVGKSFSLTVKDAGGDSGTGGNTTTPQPQQPVEQPVQKITVNKEGNVKIEIQAKKDAEGKSATAELTAEKLKEALEKAKADDKGVKAIELEIPKIEGVNEYRQQLPASAVTGEKLETRLKFKTDIADMTVTNNMLKAADLHGQNSIRISISSVDKNRLNDSLRAVIGDRPVIELKMMLGEKVIEWDNSNAPITVSIDYNPTAEEIKNPEHIVVYYIDEKGNAIPVPDGKYDAESGKITYTTTHFSKYALAYVKKSFTDLEKYSWALKPIEVLASKGIVEEVSNSKFMPEKNITRGEFMGWLIKTLGLTAEIDENFKDVSKTYRYYQEIGTAKRLCITAGVGENKFSPEKEISRQDMMILTVKALEAADKEISNGTQEEIKKFTDVSEVSEYALEYVAAMVKNGLIVGSGNKLYPTAKMTRAEATVVLYRIYSEK